MLEIKSSKNPLIKRVKSLHKKKYRLEEKLFIIEGIKIIQEAIDNFGEIEQIIYTDKLLSSNEGFQFFQNIKHIENIAYVNENLFKEISGTENPQGILGLCRLIEKDYKEIFAFKDPFLVFLDRIQDPGNMGTIIRSGDAFNIDGIILGEGCVDPYNPKVIRATMGSIFRTPIYNCNDSFQCLNDIRRNNINIITTDLNGTATMAYNFNDGIILVIGNESNGVDESLLEISNEKIKIPMPGGAESLNAGVAASIIMYEAMKSRF